MKLIMLIMLSVVSNLAYAQRELGFEIKPYEENSNPKFGIQLAHDVDTVFLLTMSVFGKDLTNGKPLSSLSYRYYDSRSNTFITNWKLYQQYPTPTHLPGTYAFQVGDFEAASVIKILKSLKSLKLVLMINNEVNDIKFISIEALCKNHPEKIFDLTTSSTGCDISE